MPVYILIYNDSRLFIPLAKASALGVAIAYNVQNVFRHRETSFPGITRPLIAYDLVLVLEPMTLIGTIFGARLNKIVPYFLTSAMMLVLGFFIAQKTWQKGTARWNEENKKKITPSLYLTAEKKETKVVVSPDACIWDKGQIENIAATLLTKQFPFWQLLRLLFGWTTVIATTLLSEQDISGLMCGTLQYWAVVLSPIPILCALTFITVRYEIVRTKRLRELGYLFECSDVIYDCSRMFEISVVCIIAGLMSGLVGLGGSTIKGPYLHFLIADADVSKATSCFMLLTTASTSMFIYIWIGLLDATHGIIFTIIGFFGGLIGTNIIDSLVKRLGRKSLIILALATYVYLGMFIMFILSVIKDTADFQSIRPKGKFLIEFHSLCQHHSPKNFHFW